MKYCVQIARLFSLTYSLISLNAILLVACGSNISQAASRSAVIQKAFWASLQSRDERLVEKFLCAGARPNWLMADKKIPLITILAEHTDDVVKRHNLVKLLLKFKADPNIPVQFLSRKDGRWREHLGLYPLHIAVGLPDKDLVRLLLEAGACTQVMSESIGFETFPPCMTPLHLACHKDSKADVDIVRLLTQAGSYVNMQVGDQKDTPLHCAVARGDVLLIAHLLHVGADPTIRNADGCTPLHAAVMYDDICAVWALSRRVSMNIPIQHDDEKMHAQIVFAGHNPHNKHIEKLREKCGPYNIFREGHSPLALAFPRANPGTIRGLLEAGADANTKGFFDIRPIHLAICAALLDPHTEKHVENIALLLEKGANPNVWARLYKQGKIQHVSPLLLALDGEREDIFSLLYDWFMRAKPQLDTTYGGYLESVLAIPGASPAWRIDKLQKLLAIGADIEQVDTYGCSILHAAVLHRTDTETVKYLIACQAPLMGKSPGGFSAYDYALINRSRDLIDLFKPYEAKRLALVAEPFSSLIDPSIDIAREDYDPRIGNVDRLKQCLLYFNAVPGFESVFLCVYNSGRRSALHMYPKMSQVFGAINNAKGALFELNAAYHLFLEKQAIKAFRVYYGGLEFDIETPDYLVECKNIKWKLYPFIASDNLKVFFIQHQLVAQSQQKKFLIYSYNQIPILWKTWFEEHNMSYREYKEVAPI